MSPLMSPRTAFVHGSLQPEVAFGGRKTFCLILLSGVQRGHLGEQQGGEECEGVFHGCLTLQTRSCQRR